MREQLVQYVNLLFAGATDCDEVRQEILQNTLDRYDDLVEQGKSPEAAYRLAISGIGDINEILGTQSAQTVYDDVPRSAQQTPDYSLGRILRAVAVALYILCPIPLFILSELGMDTLGLCGTLGLVAAATVLIMLGRKKQPACKRQEAAACTELTPRQELRKSINSMIWAIGLALYFIISFATNAWYITWVIFPLIGAVQGLMKAILDLKEADPYEN